MTGASFLKPLLLLAYAVNICCSPGSSLDSYASTHAKESTESLSGYVQETIPVGQLFGQDCTATFCGTSQNEILLCLWQKDAFRFVRCDRYSQTVVWEGPMLSFPYFMDVCTVKGRTYAICASTGDPLSLLLVDIETGAVQLELPTAQLPFYTQWNDSLYFTVTEKNGEQYKNVIYRYDFQNDPSKIMECSYQIGEDGTYTGESITAMNGMEGFLLVQTSKTDHDLLANGEFTVHQISLANMADTIYSTSQPYQFVSSDGEYLIASIHSEERPLKETGVVFRLLKGDSFILDKVEAANDIRFAAKDGENYWIGTTRQIMLFRSQTNDYLTVDQPENLGRFYYQDGVLSYSSGFGAEHKMTILTKNEVRYSDAIPSPLKGRLTTQLPLPSVEPLYEDDRFFYYLESSDYAGRPYQTTDAVVWRLDKNTMKAEALQSFQYVIMPRPIAQIADGKMIIQYDDNSIVIPLS